MEQSTRIEIGPQYVLVTTAYNEAEHIGRLVASVVQQSAAPFRWIIVTDGCTDATAEIVRPYTVRYPFLELMELPQHSDHNFASKVRAFNTGVSRLAGLSFEFIGNLDADVTLGSSYFAELIAKFDSDPHLGIAGGGICEWNGHREAPRPFNTTTDVAGAVQFFRRECYEAIGRFFPLKYGGEDWAAQVSAQMAGWQVRSFPELRVLHDPGPEGAWLSLRRGIRQGRMDFAMGSHPLFELVRLSRRVRIGLPALVCLVRLAAFMWGYCKREKRLVSREFIRFLRAQEGMKVRQYLHSLWPGKSRVCED
jgi:GT2 family glycosyltransferase